MTGCYADGGHDGQVDDGVCANCGQEVTAPAGRSQSMDHSRNSDETGADVCTSCDGPWPCPNDPAGRSSTPADVGVVSVVRPRKGDLEAATAPHPFRPSGEYVGYGQTRERCDLCGLVQRGPGTHHNEQETP